MKWILVIGVMVVSVFMIYKTGKENETKNQRRKI